MFYLFKAGSNYMYVEIRRHVEAQMMNDANTVVAVITLKGDVPGVPLVSFSDISSLITPLVNVLVKMA